MESQKEAILMTLIGVAKCHNKAYCWVSQKRQLELLNKYHSWNISRRTLNRRLRELEDEGYFVRVRRHIKAQDGHLIFRSTLYKFCGKLFNWLAGLKRWLGSVFGVFAVPRWSQHNSLQESQVSGALSPSVEMLLIKERNGTLSRWGPRTGAYGKVT
jgi:hypothetical protein